jgi:hypothetical protein
MIHEWRTSVMAVGPEHYEVTWCIRHGEVAKTAILVASHPILAGYR